ncbi:GlsB/YeaQ/YmgE family stress response membrane protein [Anaerosporomusa subterranea]|nr:GlsB/YeaQ/YmgE family stress response membrane protein [Anaerosporomusa subterranea]
MKQPVSRQSPLSSVDATDWGNVTTIQYTHIVIKRYFSVMKGVAITGILSWIIVGAFAGWIASIITGKNAQMGAIANIVTGVGGAIFAGFVLKYFGIDGVTGFNLYSIIVAIGGATALLYIVGLFKK